MTEEKHETVSVIPEAFNVYFFDRKKDIETLVTDLHRFVINHDATDFPLERVNRIAYGLALFLWRRNADGGKLLVRKNQIQSFTGVDFLVLDKKKGMPYLDTILKKELGELLKLVDFYDAFHQAEYGNAVLIRIWNRKPENDVIDRVARMGSVITAKPGQKVSGDGCAACWDSTEAKLLVSDGLGSGSTAHTATETAITSFCEKIHERPYNQIRFMDTALKKTRGAAVALAEISREEICYCAIGNISGRIFKTELESKACLSYNGTIGYQMPEFKEIVYPFPENGLFLMFSDGLTPVWSLSNYMGIMQHDPTLIAAVLYRDFGKGTDDISIVVLKRD